MGRFIITCFAGFMLMCAAGLFAVGAMRDEEREAKAKRAQSESSTVADTIADIIDYAGRKVRDGKKSPQQPSTSERELAAKVKALEERLSALTPKPSDVKQEPPVKERREAEVGDVKRTEARLASLGTPEPKVAPELVQPEAEEEADKENSPSVDPSQSEQRRVTTSCGNRQGFFRRVLSRCRIFSCFRR